MIISHKLIILLLAFLFSNSLLSEYSDEILSFENKENRVLYYNLIEELRCPKCQNQNLLDSNAPLALDLKNQLYILVNDGYKRNEIKEYMRARYGDFILYSPPLNFKTLILWLLPMLVFLISVLVFLAKFIKSDNHEK